MTPRGRLFSLDAELSVAQALPQVIAQPYSRIPVYEDDHHNVVKVINLRDLLKAISEGRADLPLKRIAHQPLFVSQ